MGTKKYPLESFQTHYPVQRKHIILKIERFRNGFFFKHLPLSCFLRRFLLHILTVQTERMMATIKKRIPPMRPAVTAFLWASSGTSYLYSSLQKTQQWLHNAHWSHWLAQVSTLDLMGIYTLESFQTHYPVQWKHILMTEIGIAFRISQV